MFASTIDDINYDMVYTIAAYHDIGHHIDAKNHEKISAEILLADDNLKKFFTEDELKIMSEAVYDHRASLEGDPRSIYGKIVSSADRNTLVDGTCCLQPDYDSLEYVTFAKKVGYNSTEDSRDSVDNKAKILQFTLNTRRR